MEVDGEELRTYRCSHALLMVINHDGATVTPEELTNLKNGPEIWAGLKAIVAREGSFRDNDSLHKFYRIDSDITYFQEKEPCYPTGMLHLRSIFFVTCAEHAECRRTATRELLQCATSVALPTNTMSISFHSDLPLSQQSFQIYIRQASKQ